MRTALIFLQTGLLLLALFERSTAQTDPRQHQQQLCNVNRHCSIKATCYTKSAERCPFKDEDGKCFAGTCVCRKNHNLMYPACKFEQPPTEATTLQPATTKEPSNQCGRQCTGDHSFCRADGNCECRYGGRWPLGCCFHKCPKRQRCNNRGECVCSGKRLASGRCSACLSPCDRRERCKRGVCRKFWPCKKCGSGGKCRISRSKEICSTCGRGRKYFRGKCYTTNKWRNLCKNHCGRKDKRAKCRAEKGRKLLTCISCGQGFKRVKSKDRFICEELAKWSQWGIWGSCSVTCGGDGVQLRTRECSKSGECSGKASETRPCQPVSPACPPTFSEWTDWSECSVTCGSGLQTRTRTCMGPPCQVGMTFTDEKDCKKSTCNVDCKWCEWERVGGNCGPTRTRRPNCPAKAGQGAICVGEDKVTITKVGTERWKDFHSSTPETNLFKIECRGGCINIIKVVHDCSSHSSRNSRADELKLVRDLCQDKESCEFRPAPSFFGPRTCTGIKKTWFRWNCKNHEKEFSFHQEDL